MLFPQYSSGGELPKSVLVQYGFRVKDEKEGRLVIDESLCHEFENIILLRQMFQSLSVEQLLLFISSF